MNLNAIAKGMAVRYTGEATGLCAYTDGEPVIVTEITPSRLSFAHARCPLLHDTEHAEQYEPGTARNLQLSAKAAERLAADVLPAEPRTVVRVGRRVAHVSPCSCSSPAQGYTPGSTAACDYIHGATVTVLQVAMIGDGMAFKHGDCELWHRTEYARLDGPAEPRTAVRDQAQQPTAGVWVSWDYSDGGMPVVCMLHPDELSALRTAVTDTAGSHAHFLPYGMSLVESLDAEDDQQVDLL